MAYMTHQVRLTSDCSVGLTRMRGSSSSSGVDSAPAVCPMVWTRLPLDAIGAAWAARAAARASVARPLPRRVGSCNSFKQPSNGSRDALACSIDIMCILSRLGLTMNNVDVNERCCIYFDQIWVIIIKRTHKGCLRWRLIQTFIVRQHCSDCVHRRQLYLAPDR